ncbi:MAG: hypothetical protein AAF443_06480 [Chlamydiota bacterium]
MPHNLGFNFRDCLTLNRYGHIILQLAVISALFTSGCGYRMIGEEGNEARTTLAIPYFCHDGDGRLTAAMIKACAQSSSFRYVAHGGRWTLRGVVCSNGTEEIGWSYDRKPDGGARRNILVPVEGKRCIEVKIELIDAVTGKLVGGPFFVAASSDFDFINPDSPRDAAFALGEESNLEETILFSLGQLDSRFGAQGAATTSIYQRVAQKVFFGLDHLLIEKEELE